MRLWVRLTYFVRSLGQAGLWSDVPPSRGIWWPRVVLHWVSLTFGHPFGQMYPLVVASSGQEWYYVRSAGHLVNLWVRLTFGQMYLPVEASSGQEWYLLMSSWPELRCNPQGEASGGQEWYYMRLARHLVILWSDVPPGSHPLGQADFWSDVSPLIEASSGQEWYFVRSAWHLVSLWVRLTLGQMYLK